ncbi:hypothetical protein PQR34_46185 [Paraburkholderia sediminicola]|uniref:hypothetical protein n=1 Tax=Paraburkholderia sediminicola TaxID=458836 RepID=UPI0038BCC898
MTTLDGAATDYADSDALVYSVSSGHIDIEEAPAVNDPAPGVDGTFIPQGAFTIEAVSAGLASYVNRCRIVCYASASSKVTQCGGTIHSGTDITITAGAVSHNIGGNVFARGDICVNAPAIYAQDVFGNSAINQERGFKAFFGSTRAKIFATDVSGDFTADGPVTLTRDDVSEDGYFSWPRSVSASAGTTTVRPPTSALVQLGERPGLTTWWWR